MKKFYLFGVIIITISLILIPTVSSIFSQEKNNDNINQVSNNKSVIRIMGCFENYNDDLTVERLKIVQIGILNPLGVYLNVHIVGKSYSISFFEPCPIKNPTPIETYWNENIELNINCFIGLFNLPDDETVCLNGWAIGVEII